MPGSTNTVADSESRKFVKQDTEWMLNPSSLKVAIDILGLQPNSYLFASQLNHQFSQYCSYWPDPGALYLDAFSISWSCYNVLLLYPLQLYPESSTKHLTGKINWNYGSARLANTVLVPNNDISASQATSALVLNHRLMWSN